MQDVSLALGDKLFGAGMVTQDVSLHLVTSYLGREWSQRWIRIPDLETKKDKSSWEVKPLLWRLLVAPETAEMVQK